MIYIINLVLIKFTKDEDFNNSELHVDLKLNYSSNFLK